MDEYDSVSMTALSKLGKDLRKASAVMGDEEARVIVDLYYSVQKQRVGTNNAVKAIEREAIKANEEPEPAELLTFFLNQQEILEEQIKAALGKYAMATPVGAWLNSIHGIGPVISAAFLAHFDITKAPTAGHYLSFAGQNPNIVWEKGQKRPYNARLKVVCFHAGNCFIRLRGYKNDIYGKLYDTRKAYEMTRNANGELADQAAHVLATKKFGLDTVARSYYEKGRLPPAHIHSRVRRWIVRLLISHSHDVSFYCQYGFAGPRPYANEYLDHGHYVQPPNMKKIDGLEKALAKRGPGTSIEDYYQMMVERWGIAAPSKEEEELTSPNQIHPEEP